MEERITFAPKKKQSVSLTKFLHENEKFVRYDFTMSDRRVGRYLFDKESRCVRLFTGDLGDGITTDDPCLMFPAKDWFIFYNYVWNDLNNCGDAPLYIAEWDSEVPQTRYRVVGDHCRKLPDDFVYIFRCNDKTKIMEYTWPIPESEHHKYYDLVYLFQWKDVRMFDNIFSCIDKLFRWCQLYDHYTSVKVKLFHPERCVSASRTGLLSPPTYYSH